MAPVLDSSTATEVQIDIARLLVNAGSEMDSITFPILLIWAIRWDLETILSFVGNNDNFHWDVIQLDLYSFDWYMAFCFLRARSDDLLAYQLKFDKFVKLCKRLKIDLAFTQPDGLTLLHWMFDQPFGEQISDVKHCLSVLVSNGVDPCAVCEGYLTPTLVAFFLNKLGLWFTVLRQSGISVEAVAAHALGLLVGNTMLYHIVKFVSKPMNRRCESLHSFTVKWINSHFKGLSKFELTEQLRADLIEAFERQGCYLNESSDRGNMITYKASSSVDFKPSTVYDPERASRDIRRRTGARKNPQ